jgi:hypothetical protein
MRVFDLFCRISEPSILHGCDPVVLPNTSRNRMARYYPCFGQRLGQNQPSHACASRGPFD